MMVLHTQQGHLQDKNIRISRDLPKVTNTLTQMVPFFIAERYSRLASHPS